MYFKYKNLKNQEQTITLPITKTRFKEIKNEVEDLGLEDLGYWEFWDIRDYLFKTLIIDSFKNDLMSFFENIHLNKFESYNKVENTEIKAVDVYYHFYNEEEIYLFSEPSVILYPNHNMKRLETRLEYDTEELEFLLEQILDSFDVNYVNWKNDEYDLSSTDFELGVYFGDLTFECWTKTKEKLKSKLIGLISYATGGAGCMDLDNGNEIEETDEAISLYLKKEIQKA
ncbi:hypothetical protein [Aureivirga sp. CE67]|uniref:hypothetical protein n=1 Tax=Aureivirga sp. CE67 TaxID=1788983 RepID=UPI0018C9E805|nr:hypothetical protein [Aureivirga sp. CE67]